MSEQPYDMEERVALACWVSDGHDAVAWDNDPKYHDKARTIMAVMLKPTHEMLTRIAYREKYTTLNQSETQRFISMDNAADIWRDMLGAASNDTEHKF